MAKKKAKAKSKAAEPKGKSASANEGASWREFGLAAGVVVVLLGINSLLVLSSSSFVLRLASLVGLAFLLAVAVLCSEARRSIPMRTVLVGFGLQALLAIIVLRTPVGPYVFGSIGLLFSKILEFSMAGATFVFGDKLTSPIGPVGFVLAIQILAIIVFMGAIMRMLYYLGVMQYLVKGMAWAMRRLMRASGAESLASASNVFVGMVESALTVRPYVARMTRSELFTMMSAGMATVAGSVMAIYIGKVQGFLGAQAAGHLLTASVMSAPAAILIAKIMIPEREQPETADVDAAPAMDEGDAAPTNLMDAAAKGALEGLHLALSVVALLIAFVALVATGNAILSWVTSGHLTFDSLVGYLCSPIAVGMGLPWGEAVEVGTLLGQKTVLNEFVAYDSLAAVMSAPVPALGPRTGLIMSYALCGFANLGSVAIMIAGIGGIAPKQRPRLARLGLLSIVSGSLAAFMTGCFAGLLS